MLLLGFLASLIKRNWSEADRKSRQGFIGAAAAAAGEWEPAGSFALSLGAVGASLFLFCVEGRRHAGLDSWVRKIPGRRKRQPSPALLPGKSPRARAAWWATVPGITKCRTELSDWTCKRASRVRSEGWFRWSPHHLGGGVCLRGRSGGNALYLAFAPSSSTVASWVFWSFCIFYPGFSLTEHAWSYF